MYDDQFHDRFMYYISVFVDMDICFCKCPALIVLNSFTRLPACRSSRLQCMYFEDHKPTLVSQFINY